MMKILNCTLGDRGYYIDWDFSSDLSKRYVQYLDYND